MSNSDNYYSGEDEQYQTRSLDPEIRYHLTHHTRSVSVDKWVEVILDLSLDKLSDWSTRLSHRKLLHTSTSVMKNLKRYCEASQEIDQHISWASIVNEIISLAPELITDLPVFSLPIIFLHNPTPPEDDGGPGRRSPDLAILPRPLLPNDPKETDRQQDDEVLTVSDKWCRAVSCAAFTSRNQAQLQMSYEALQAGLSKYLGGIDQASNNTRIANTTKPSPNPPTDPRAPSVDDILRTDFTSTATGKRKATSSSPSPDFAVKRLRTDSESSESLTPDLPQYDTERLANYALCFLSFSSGVRAHCLQFLVDGHRLMLWYYDAGGIIRSEWLYWIDDLPKFAAIMVAFASLDIRGWGISNIPNLRPPPNLGASTGPLPSSLSGYTLSMPYRSPEGVTQQVKVTLQTKVFTSQSLVGRRTHVYDITTEPEISKKPLVLKMSMQTGDRTPENEFIERATNNGVNHIPEMHMWSNRDTEWRLSDGVWGNLFSDNEEPEVYEDRCQRLIVFTKYEPVERIISPANMHNLVMQLIDCIHELRHKACILHRDISLGNLLYEQLVGGTIKIILNDFDHATMVDDHGCPTTPNSSKHPAGTLPFMAHELLNPYTNNSVTHYVRHDFESAFLVALWLIIKSFLRTKATTEDALNAQNAGRETLKFWACGPVQQIYFQKQNLFTTRRNIATLAKTVAMGHYKDWVTSFCGVFITAYKLLDDLVPIPDPDSDSEPDPDAYPDSDSEENARKIRDIETLDGLISRKSIQKVLRRWEKGKRKIIEGFVPRFRVKRRKTAS